jgi:TRAP-type C4-dicarboxylate transport system permease large subunit
MNDIVPNEGIDWRLKKITYGLSGVINGFGVVLLLASMISEQGLNRYVVLAAILFLYLLLGCILDPGSMIILTIPIVFPLIQSLGFDPIWFGVIIVMVAEIGAITPPVGLNVFVVAGVARDVSLEEIFKGIIPFWLADMVRLFLLVMIPQISLFLPNILK